MSLVLFIEISTTNTSKLHFIKTLLDYRATGNFIDYDFVYSKRINTQTISQPILVFNINGSSNKIGQISEVVDIVLYYKTYSEWMLLAISSLGKQNLILGYTQLKDYNPEVNWEKGKIFMTRYLLYYKGYQTLQKKQALKRRQEVQALLHSQTAMKRSPKSHIELTDKTKSSRTDCLQPNHFPSLVKKPYKLPQSLSKGWQKEYVRVQKYWLL